MRRALRERAAELGWTDLKKPRIIMTGIATGLWNGRRVALRYWPPGKGTPAFVAMEIELPLMGRFELRARPAKDSFFSRPLSLFRPRLIELFASEDARLRAWADDRTLVDRLLSLSGVRDLLKLNLQADDGVLTLKKGVLRIRRRIPRGKGIDFAGNPEAACEVAKQEWQLLPVAVGLG